MIPQRPNVESPDKTGTLSHDWIIGFVDGEGCFYVGINKNDEMRFGYQVLPEFTVVQHERDINLLHRLRSTMRCGVVRRNHGDRFCWRVRDLKSLIQIIIPFFERHRLKSKKGVDFCKFAKIVKKMVNKEHLTDDGFTAISQIVQTMNTCKRQEVRLKRESIPE